MRNDHQDALAAGLAVSEYDPRGPASEEIRGLWRWVAARLARAMAADEDFGNARRPGALSTPKFTGLAGRSPAMLSLSTWGDAGAPWDAGL
jgi:chromosome partitioning protein